MKKNFWQELPRPFTALAPLDGVTDVVFRQIVTEIGKPDVLFTEFTSVDGLLSKGSERVLDRLRLRPEEQPVVAQIWGKDPEKFYKVAKLVKKIGFAGIDINMGCPDRTVVKNGTCSALIRNPALAAVIIEATKKGAARHIPVSVKTRVGFSETDLTWIEFLLKQGIDALTVHLRTVKELSLVPAHWELMPEIVKLKHDLAPQTVLIGNGDILSLDEVLVKHEAYNCDGFMVGRGIFHNPWIFNPEVRLETVTVQERVDLFLRHIELYEKTWGEGKHFQLLKKFCKTYIQNFPGASDVRAEMMEAKTLKGLKETVLRFHESISQTAIISS